MRKKLFDGMGWMLLMAILASCSLPKKIQKARETLNANPPAGALYCAETYPAKDIFIPGDTVFVNDTVTEQGPVIEIRVNDTVTVKGQCPPTKTIREIQTVHDTLIRVDRAAISACESQLASANELNAQLNNENNGLKAFKDSMSGKVHIQIWVLIVLGVALLGWAYWRIKSGALKKLLNT